MLNPNYSKMGNRMQKSSLKEIVSQNIRAFRIEAGLTQQEVADRAGFKVSYVARLESGPQNISLEVLERIANGLKCEVSQLIGGENLVGTSKKLFETFTEAIRLLKIFESKIYSKS